MPAEATLIDEIVARVLRELGTEAVTAPVATSQSATVVAPSSEITLSGAVITQEALRQSAGSARRIRVAARAILTPSARDFIRERGMEVIRESAGSAKSVSLSCQVIVTSAAPQVAKALEGLGSAGFQFERRLLGNAQEAAAQGTSALCRAEAAIVVVFTDEPELVACLANRNGAIRGAPVRDLAGLAAIRESLKPNLLAIDPSRRGPFDLQQLLKGVLTP